QYAEQAPPAIVAAGAMERQPRGDFLRIEVAGAPELVRREPGHGEGRERLAKPLLDRDSQPALAAAADLVREDAAQGLPQDMLLRPPPQLDVPRHRGGE